MGSCCRVSGLREALAEAVSLPTAFLDSLPGFAGLSTDDVNTISTYLCCVGSSIQPVDFLPSQFIKGKSRARSKSDSLKASVAILIICAVVAVGISAVSIIGYLSAKQDKTDLEKKIADLEYAESTYLAYLDYQNGVTDLETLSAITDSPGDDLVAFIGELEQNMPKQIRVLSAVCTTTGVDMNIVVDTKEQAAMVIVQLRGFESISSVTVGAVSETADDTGVPLVSFAVSCIYKDTSPVPDLTAQAAETTPAETADSVG
jgi:type IV pilus assembly protein PilM